MYEAKLSGRGRVSWPPRASALQQAPCRDRCQGGRRRAGRRSRWFHAHGGGHRCCDRAHHGRVPADRRCRLPRDRRCRSAGSRPGRALGSSSRRSSSPPPRRSVGSTSSTSPPSVPRSTSGVPDSLALFVNVDPAVLADDRCRAELIEAWRASGFAGDVVVELTERALVASPGRLLRAIDSCREVGWRIALDDLGARAESLTALRLVRPDVAKLDLSLVDRRNHSHAASVAVAVATHRERWPLVVVAEGRRDGSRRGHRTRSRCDTPAGIPLRAPRPAPRRARGRRCRTGQVGPAEWFDPSSTRATRRVATKRHLLEVTRVVEAMASGPESIVLAAIQSSAFYTRRTRSQYAALARRCGMAGVIGGGIPPGVVRGVHHAPLADDDPLVARVDRRRARCERWHRARRDRRAAIVASTTSTGCSSTT